MSSICLAVVILEREKHADEKIKRRILRDHCNPLDVSETAFIGQYRLNKDAFNLVFNEFKPYALRSSIHPTVQLATTLRFLAEGGYQRSVGNDVNIALARSTVSKVITNALNHMERLLCSKWIKLDMASEDQQKSKRHFHEHFNIPGIIGCIDGTHVRLIKPCEDAFLYYNRKGYYSINAMIICDYNLIIHAVDACHPGSSHDAFVWNLSSSRRYFLSKYQAGERRSWLLGDGGYGLEPFLLTPFRTPERASVQHKFNVAHCSARNVVERTIGVLKNRFRCLLGAMQYSPKKVSQIINVCCALHNICRHHNVQCQVDDDRFLETVELVDENPASFENVSLQNQGQILIDEHNNLLKIKLQQ